MEPVTLYREWGATGYVVHGTPCSRGHSTRGLQTLVPEPYDLAPDDCIENMI